MNKTCAFLGNDYDFTHGKKRLRRPDLALRLRVQAQIVDLIENEDVDTFLVGEIGGFEEDAYESVLEVKKSYPDIKVILVISKLAELHPTGLDDRHLIYRENILMTLFCLINVLSDIKDWVLYIAIVISSSMRILLSRIMKDTVGLLNFASGPKIRA